MSRKSALSEQSGGPSNKRKSTLSKQSALNYGAVGGIRKRLSALGALRRRKLSRYDVHPGAKRRALQQKEKALRRNKVLLAMVRLEGYVNDLGLQEHSDAETLVCRSLPQKKDPTQVRSLIMVRLEGLEPSRAYAHHPLKMACLPFHHNRMLCVSMVPQDRIELSTHGFSVRCSTN